MNGMQSATEDELIVARATAAGVGAVAIVRLDGRGAGEVVAKMFRAAGGRSRGPVEQPRRMVFGVWREWEAAGGIGGGAGGEIIDEGMTVFFPGPHSYTGNDLAEFHCHGGATPARRLIEAAVRLGARAAEPGEFTRRAYLNGRMDLAQAEAVADLINAQTDAAARAARGQLAGGLSAKVRGIREPLLDLAAEIEARIDFPDEELGEADRERLGGMFAEGRGRIEMLLATRRRGRLLREGARVVLAGKPNAGKSSLLNALAGRERAIVTPHPGTTRDTIECTVEMAGIAVTLIDTAGLRESADPIEKLGIERTREEIERADLVVMVVDVLELVDGVDLVKRADLIVRNKCDLMGGEISKLKDRISKKNPEEARNLPVDSASHVEEKESSDPLMVSAVRGDGLADLERVLIERLIGGDGFSAAGTGDELAVGLRHAELLEQAGKNLAAAGLAFGEGLSGEFVMVDLKEALDALSRILGTEIGDAVLDRIFNKFCIGK